KAALSVESRKSNVDLLQLDGPQFGRCQRAPQIDMRKAFPGIADAAVHLDRGLAHRPARLQYPFAPRAARISSAGASSSTAQAACRSTLTEPSISARLSASRCAMA